MRTLGVCLALVFFATPLHAELTPNDVRIIRDLIREENAVLETRLREYADLKFEILDTKFTTKLTELDTKFTTKLTELDTKFTTEFKRVDNRFESVEKRQNFIMILVTGLIALIVLAVGIPQILLLFKQKGQDTLAEEVKTLREQLEALRESVELFTQTRAAK